MGRILLAAALLYLLAGGACAADTRLTLHGKVVDENGLPVSNVQVKLEGLQKAIFTASTDDAGYFSISNLEPGTYSVHLEKISFFLLRGQTIELAADATQFSFTTDARPGSARNRGRGGGSEPHRAR